MRKQNETGNEIEHDHKNLAGAARVAHVGGNANNGSNAGPFYVNSNNSSSNSNANIGRQLSLFHFSLRLRPGHASWQNTKQSPTGAGTGNIGRLWGEISRKAKMAKRHGNLFNQVVSLQNLERAHAAASRGKGHYREVKMVNRDPGKYLGRIRRRLAEGRFCTAPYLELRKNEYGKQRVIHKLPYFPDRIVHHAIVQVAVPIWDKTLIRDTYACIRGRGIHDGVRRVKKALMDGAGTRYCLKMDARQFYPSMDHDVLKAVIRAKIKDRRLLGLIDEVIGSFWPGVPIGNYLSQFFGNLYLSGYDHWMKEVQGCRYYFRYCDDVVVLGADKERLHELRRLTRDYWRDRLRIDLKGNWQVFPVDARGVDFLGYRFFHGYTLLRKSIAKKFKRKMQHVRVYGGRMQPISVLSSVMSYEGWLRHANCLNLKKSGIDQDVRAVVAAAAAAGNMADPMKKCFI